MTVPSTSTGGVERLRAARVVIIDLDGTLHDDPDAYRHYATRLQEKSGQYDLLAEVDAIVNRRHPAAAPGDFVHVSRCLALQAPEWTPLRAVAWDGTDAAVPDDLLGQPIGITGPAEDIEPRSDADVVRYLGDLWQITGAVASVRGLDSELSSAAFADARHSVNRAPLRRVDGSTQLLDLLRPGRHLVVATNTSEWLARPLVERLGLDGLVDGLYYAANKPVGCAALVQGVCGRWNVEPDQVAVVGDNLVFDLLPAVALGCATAHIDPLGTDPTGRWSTVRATSMRQLSDALTSAVPSRDPESVHLTPHQETPQCTSS